MTAKNFLSATVAKGLLVVMLSGYFSSGIGADLLRPDVAAVTEFGERIYQQHCAVCHGINLEGQPDWRKRHANGRLPAPPHDETGHTWHHPSQQLFDITKYGLAKIAGDDYKTDMVAYDGILRDDEIIAVLSFIKSRWPAEIRERHDQMSQ